MSLESKLRTSYRLMKPRYRLGAGPEPGKQHCVFRAKGLEGVTRDRPGEKLSG